MNRISQTIRQILALLRRGILWVPLRWVPALILAYLVVLLGLVWLATAFSPQGAGAVWTVNRADATPPNMQSADSSPPSAASGAAIIAAVTPAPLTPTAVLRRPGSAAGDYASMASIAISNATPASIGTPTPVPSPDERLHLGMELLRLGDYAGARAQFNSLLNSSLPNNGTVDRSLRVQARYELAKSYLAEDLFSQALAALNELDSEFSLALAAAQPLPEEHTALQYNAWYLRAEALTGLGQYAEALSMYRQFLDAYPWMSGIVQQKLAGLYLVLGDRPAAAAAYRIAADEATTVVQQVTMLEALAGVYKGMVDYGAAVAAYDEILAVAQNAGYRAQIQLQAAEALAAAGDEAGAIERWLATTNEAPATKIAHEALVELVTREVNFDLYLRGYINLEAGVYLPAINAFEAYLESAPADDARRGQALHLLGQSYVGAGNYSEALVRFTQVQTDYGDCTCFGQAVLDIARAQAGLGDGVTARRTYRTFARDYAADPLAPEALWRSGLLALQEGNQIEAAVDFLALADAFPSSDRAPAALYTVGYGAYRNGVYTQAVDALARLQREYPDYRWDATAFWLGRAHQAAGDREQAATVWQQLATRAPDIYYGVLAAQSLRRPQLTGGSFLTDVAAVTGPRTTLSGDDGSRAFAELWLANWLAIDAVALARLPTAVAEDVDLRAGRLLIDMGMRGDGLAALERAYERYKDDLQALYALSLAFEDLHTYRLSLIAMDRLLQLSPAGLVENAPIFLQQRAYPRRFADLITNEATAHDLDPLLLFSLIRQESLFEEGARSVAAAQGLAQIIPATGAWIADQLDYPGYFNEMVYRPYINVKFGAYYLDHVRDSLDGNLVSALAGYNGGPGNSVDWRNLSGRDDVLFVETIEFSETRLYIQLITRNYYHYTRLYGTN